VSPGAPGDEPADGAGGRDLLAAAAALDTLLDPFLWIDHDRRIAYANEAVARLVGRPRREVTGGPVSATLAGGLRDLVLAACDEVLAHDRPLELERRIDDGEPVWYRVLARPHHDGVAVQLHDITAGRRVRDRLATVQHMETLGTLAGGLAHDLNNLLMVISGHAELLEDAVVGDDEALVDVAAIRDATHRAAALTERLLAFGRRRSPRLVDLDLAAIVDDLAPLLRSAVPGHADLEVRTTSTPRVRADPSSVAQALVNVVVNAGEAVGEGGRIVVATHPEQVDEPTDGGPAPGLHGAISVHDDGDGMTPDVVERAIEPFFTTRGERGATGLGLSAAYRYLAEVGGHLHVDSAVGRGTTVRLLLPARTEG
jgi:hypothetical protein